MAKVNNIVFNSINKLIRPQFHDNNADVEFILVENNYIKTIRAHERYLSVASIVFDNMFTAHKPSTSGKLIVEIKGIDFNAFNTFIQYLYGEEIHINARNFETLQHLGKMYLIDDIVSRCKAFVNDCVTAEKNRDPVLSALVLELSEIQAKFVNIIDMTTLTIA